MKLLFFYWSMILVGYFFGSKMRDFRKSFAFLGPLLTAIVMTLVFVMGTRMGSNKDVIQNLHTIGLEAAVLTVFVMAGSVLAVFFCRKLMGLNFTARDNPASVLENGGVKGNNSGNKMSMTILFSVVLGLLAGYLIIPRLFNLEAFDLFTAKFMVVGISILLLCVGIELGLSGNIGVNIKTAGFKVFIFPAAVVLGSFIGAILAAFFLPISQKEALAVASGFGWYTLAPIIITEHGYVLSGAISFIHNVMREFGGIVLIPIVAKKIGCIEAASLPGVAAMDVVLPLLEQVCGEKIIIYSFLIGLFQSATVPLLVPLFISL